jgi:hypothetical protein
LYAEPTDDLDLSIPITRGNGNPQIDEETAGLVHILEQTPYRRSLLFGGMKSA